MKKVFYGTAALLIICGLTSCATIFTGTHDTVTFTSEPDGAEIFIDGMSYGTTPATISVSKGIGQKEVVLKLDGYEDRTFMMDESFNVVSILNVANVLFWGIDFVTGAMMNYRPHYSVSMDPMATSYQLQDLPRGLMGAYVIPGREKSVSIVDREAGVQIVFSK